ncbi:MAG: hypothetical protein K2O01_06220, partial [Bacteroidales bacterium]|nr:hypothetical protein [Bacteroidales bacterium]
MKRYGILMMAGRWWLAMGGGLAAACGTVDTVRPKLHAVGRVKDGANWLRWAPDTPDGWERLLQKGVVVERFVYAGDTVLSSEWRRPPVSSSDSVVFAEIVAATDDPWTAAMGELLFADSLEIGPSGGRFSRLSQELEQRRMRFAMALLISDRSYAAACAGLLGWRDSVTVEPADASASRLGGHVAGKPAVTAYLYRIYVPEADMDTALVLLRPQDGLLLPPRTLLAADFSDRVVSLRWDSRLWSELCVGYYVERAVGNGPFETCNVHPIDVLQRDRAGATELYYIDSLPERRKVRYRVMGVDLFGDRYQVTGEASGAAEAAGLSVPQIVQASAVSRGGVELRWRYPAAQEKALARFEVFVKDSMY